MSREMKYSGIPWIGDIPKGWEVKRLKYSCKLFGRIGFRGYTTEDLVDENEGAITLSPTNMNGMNLDFSKCSYLSWGKYYESPEIMVEIGDVLLVKTASVGKCSYVEYLPKETTINPQILLMKEHNDCSKFIAYLFQTTIGETYINITKGGSTVFTISQERIGNYEFAFPSLSEQQKIASFLDKKCAEVDEMVTLQEKIIEELKAYKQSVITEAVTKGLNPNVPMKESGIEWIGQIPAHWEIKPIKYIKSKERNAFTDGPFGSNLKSEHFIENGDILVIESGFITTGKFIYKDFKTITKEHFETIKRSECKAKDIIIAKIGANYGMAGELPYLDKPSVVSGNSLKITLDNEKYLNPIFVYAMITAKNNNGFIDLVQENAQPALSLSGLNNFRLPTPPIFEQNIIANYLDHKCSAIDNLISIKQQKIEHLKEYKKSIIYEYVTGKKEVED